jgi:endonuclease YncB( thermonuclease family)
MTDRGKDNLGRTIAIVWLPDGTSLNEELVKRGLAWWSDKYAPQDSKLKQLHAAARAAHIGLWSAPNPIPPWIWRNGQKDVHATIKPSE